MREATIGLSVLLAVLGAVSWPLFAIHQPIAGWFALITSLFGVLVLMAMVASTAQSTRRPPLKPPPPPQ